MVWIPGGEFSMGAAEPPGHEHGRHAGHDDSRPIHRVYVDGFWMDKTDVTNAQFAKFVEATGYVTIAERTPRAEDFPGAPPENLVAGSVVFSPPDHPVPLNDHFQWWCYVKGANWRHPHGPGSDIKGKRQLPGRPGRLRRRRGLRDVGGQAPADRSGVGVRRPRRPERQALSPGATSSSRDGKWMANTHPGHFPDRTTGETATPASRRWRSSRRTATASTTWPATSGSGPATGIVPTTTRSSRPPDASRATRTGPTRPSIPREPTEKKRVHRGGSFLCTDQYCSRYMVGTRGKGESSTGTNHVGFRLVKTS